MEIADEDEEMKCMRKKIRGEGSEQYLYSENVSNLLITTSNADQFRKLNSSIL